MVLTFAKFHNKHNKQHNKNDKKLKVAKFLKIRSLGGEAYHPKRFSEGFLRKKSWSCLPACLPAEEMNVYNTDVDKRTKLSGIGIKGEHTFCNKRCRRHICNKLAHL